MPTYNIVTPTGHVVATAIGRDEAYRVADALTRADRVLYTAVRS